MDFSTYSNFMQDAFKGFWQSFESCCAKNSEQNLQDFTKKNFDLVAKIVDISTKALKEIVQKGSESLNKNIDHANHILQQTSDAQGMLDAA